MPTRNQAPTPPLVQSPDSWSLATCDLQTLFRACFQVISCHLIPPELASCPCRFHWDLIDASLERNDPTVHVDALLFRSVGAISRDIRRRSVAEVGLGIRYAAYCIPTSWCAHASSQHAQHSMSLCERANLQAVSYSMWITAWMFLNPCLAKRTLVGLPWPTSARIAPHSYYGGFS